MTRARGLGVGVVLVMILVVTGIARGGGPPSTHPSAPQVSCAFSPAKGIMRVRLRERHRQLRAPDGLPPGVRDDLRDAEPGAAVIQRRAEGIAVIEGYELAGPPQPCRHGPVTVDNAERIAPR